MSKIHIIPYGYRMADGNIVVEPHESEIVKTIFKDYIGGTSYRKIAEKLSAEGHIYYDESGKWSGGAVKKMLFREEYIGKNGFPKIISENDLETVKIISAKRRKNEIIFSDDNRILRKITFCGECRERLERFGNKVHGKSSGYWRCTNEKCSRLGFSITDESLTAAFDAAVMSAERNNNIKTKFYEINSSVIFQQNLIEQMLDSDISEHERISAEIIKLAALKYECITYKCSEKETEQVSELIRNYSAQISKRAELLRTCVRKITVKNNGSVTIEFRTCPHSLKSAKKSMQI